MKNKFEKIKIFSKRMRKAILETSFKCGEPSHIGGALSIVDIMAVLYGDILDINGKKIGKHDGIINYTIGQRKGIKISNIYPLY